jgi:hypothetical protein
MDRLYKYFTHKTTYRYIDVIPKFFRAYNDTEHSATAMAPSKVGDSDILATLNKNCARQSKIKTAVGKFRAGQHVRISKEKLKFAKSRSNIIQLKFSRYANWCTEVRVPSTNWKIC